MPTPPPSKIITCAMVDANGFYDGSAGSLTDPSFTGDIVFQGECPNGCTIKVHSINTGGNVRVMNCATVIVTGTATIAGTTSTENGGIYSLQSE